MKKKGQFFIITALIIAGITIGFGTLYNTAKIEQSEDVKVYEFTEELHSELQQAYDSGIINAKSSADISNDIRKLAEYYASQNPDSNFVILYGGPGELKTYYSKEGLLYDGGTHGTVTSEDADGTVVVCMNFVDEDDTESGSREEESSDSSCLIQRQFELNSGQKFFVVVRKKVKNEELVVAR